MSFRADWQLTGEVGVLVADMRQTVEKAVSGLHQGCIKVASGLHHGTLLPQYNCIIILAKFHVNQCDDPCRCMVANALLALNR